MQLPKTGMKNLWYRLSCWRFSQHQQLLHKARYRTLSTCVIACVAYVGIAVRLIDVMVIRTPDCNSGCQQQESQMRQNITDRNGVILATQLVTASVYANPKVIINAKEAAKKLSELFPHLTYKKILKKLESESGFIWIERHVSPKMQQAVHSLGIPGVYLMNDSKRVYPHGSLACHVIGRCDIDGVGVSGIEAAFDNILNTQPTDLKLSLDIRVQHIVHNELKTAIEKFQAMAGNAMVMDVQTGEIIAMVSLPEYDLNRPMQSMEVGFNRNTLGVYEQGSTFKILNAAIALETGVANENSIFDATNAYKIGRFAITDFKGQNRPLTLTEALVHSSNIAAIKICQKYGLQVQKRFMEIFGVLRPANLEISELGKPLVPSNWNETSMMTISYGYGISVTPLHTLVAIAGVVNDGYRPTPTLKFVSQQNRSERIKLFRSAPPCISRKTSATLRKILRKVIMHGTATANVEGYQVFGKTGTAYQIVGKGGYGSDANRKRTTSFIGGFSANNPRYVLILMLDDPKATKETYGYAAAGWNAKPTAGKIIERIAPLLGVEPDFNSEEGGAGADADAMQLTKLSEIGD
jgi:cell division protein FtsI (penicillin-binding protein 3)